MIKYVIAQKRSRKDGSIKYYAEAANITPVYLDEIARRISSSCTVTEENVHAVITVLEEQLRQCLSEGRSVRLGDIGSFCPMLSVTTVDTPDEVTADSIKRVSIRFTPNPRMAAALRIGAGGVTIGRLAGDYGKRGSI